VEGPGRHVGARSPLAGSQGDAPRVDSRRTSTRAEGFDEVVGDGGGGERCLRGGRRRQVDLRADVGNSEHRLDGRVHDGAGGAAGQRCRDYLALCQSGRGQVRVRRTSECQCYRDDEKLLHAHPPFVCVCLSSLLK